MSNSVKEETKLETEKSFFHQETFSKNSKTFSSVKTYIKNKVLTVQNSSNNYRNIDYHKIEEKSSNFSNYQKLSKNTFKLQSDFRNHDSNNTSITNNCSKKNSLNMSFLNQFIEKNLTPNIIRKKILNENFEKNISSFSFQFTNSMNSQNFPSKIEIENESPPIPKFNTERIDSFYKINESNHKNNFLYSNLNLDLINKKIFNEFPEFLKKKSDISTKEETLKLFNSNNYNSKNIEIDTIEHLHFSFVKFIHKSKQIMSSQETKNISPTKIEYSEINVIKVEEVDID